MKQLDDLWVYQTAEIEFEDFLKENNIFYYRNCRSVITPQEIDFYLPEYKIGFELDGLYWHSEQQKPKNYHLDKTEKCEEKGKMSKSKEKINMKIKKLQFQRK